jgi:hypothetical protein
METLGGPCCWGTDDGRLGVEEGVTVVLMVVVPVPDEVPVCDVPVCDDVLGTGCGAGTVDGDGMLEPPCGDDVDGTELGAGTCDSGGCGGTVCCEVELWAAPQTLSNKRTRIRRRGARSFRRCIVSRLGINP